MIESELLQLRRALQTELLLTEDRIFSLETRFLEEAALNGNQVFNSRTSPDLGNRKSTFFG